MRSTAAATLKEITSSATCPACIVITSPDRVRRTRTLEYLLKHFIKDRTNKVPSFTCGEAGRTSPTAFLRDLEEPSLFEPTRFAVIRAIETAKAADVEPISDFLRKGVPGTHLFIIGESLPNTPNFKKTIEAQATHLAFEQLKGAELRRWVEREAKQNQIEDADDAVIELLISLGNEEPESIAQLIEKFSLYLGESQASQAALRALEPGRAHASDFELADTVLGRNRGVTEALLTQLIGQGSSPFMLIGLLTKTFTSLLRIRSLLDNGVGPHDIRNSMGLTPWIFSKYLPLAKLRTTDQLSKIIEGLLIADFRLKDRSLGPAALFSSVAQAAGENASAGVRGGRA
ncbi:MAG: DNA polymerase III subunit delta [Pseudomonadota bacterium]|jgi:DNA polymerase III delta subunit